MTPEGKVKKKVREWLIPLKGWFYMPVQNGLGRSGIPDFIACVPVTITTDMVGKTIGRFVAIETKAAGKRDNTTPNQDRELLGINRAGGVGLVVDDVSQLHTCLLVSIRNSDEQQTDEPEGHSRD